MKDPVSEYAAESRQALYFLDSIIEAIPNMVLVKEARDLRFVRFNKAGEELLGLPREEMIGKNDYDLFPKEQADFFTSHDRWVLKSGEPLDIPEEPVDTPNGKRWLHTQKIPLLGPDGSPAFLLGISRDITENRMLDRERDDLIAVASHELRSPASAIVGSLTTLADALGDAIPPDASETLALTLENAERLVHLLDDCLDMSLLTAKNLRFDADSFDLARLLEDAIRLNGPYAIRLASHYTLSDSLPSAPVRGDRHKLMQALTNLLTNAAKFSRKGASVVVSLMEQGESYLVSIEDRGPGIPEEFRSRIFHRFSRSRSDATAAMEGSGLGLAITKRIIEAHGGRIGYRCEFTRGTTFYFTVPKASDVKNAQ